MSVNGFYLSPSHLTDDALVSRSVKAILAGTIGFIEIDPIIERDLLKRVLSEVLKSDPNNFTQRKISNLACALSSVNWQDQQKVSSVLNSLGNQFLEQKGPLDTSMGNALLSLIKIFIRVSKDTPGELSSTMTLLKNRLPKPAVQPNMDGDLDDNDWVAMEQSTPSVPTRHSSTQADIENDWLLVEKCSDDTGIPMTETFSLPIVPAVQTGISPPPPIPRSPSSEESEKLGKPAIKKR